MFIALLIAAVVLLLSGFALNAQAEFTGPQGFPAWCRDYTNREHVLPGGIRLNPAAFSRKDAVTVTATANAIVGATSISVEALSGAIPSGHTLIFDAAGTPKIATLTAAAAKGATSITVAALATQVDDGDTATWAGTGKVYAKAGTLLGRTFAERATKDPFEPWATGDDEVFLLLFDNYDVEANADGDVLRPGTLIAENLLPDWDTLTADQKAAIRSTYQTTIGQP